MVFKRRFFELGKTECSYCGDLLNEDPINDKKVCVDHVIPKSKNGKQHESNLTFSCYKCNSRKGVLSVLEFKLKSLKRINEIEQELAYHKRIIENGKG